MIYTVTNMENLIRAELNEASQYLLTSPNILAALNDGYKATAAEGLSVERETNVVTISGETLIYVGDANVKQVSIVSLDGLVGFADTLGVVFTDTSAVEWADPATGAAMCKIGLPSVLPNMVGGTLVEESQSYPQGWFQWGEYIYVQPVPADRYQLILYTADHPTAALVNTTDVISDLPVEFHECVTLYARFLLCLKLHKYAKAGAYYNRYSQLLMLKKATFISRAPDPPSIKRSPVKVTMEAV